MVSSTQPAPPRGPPPFQWLIPCAIIVTPTTTRTSSSATKAAFTISPFLGIGMPAGPGFCAGQSALLGERQHLQVVGHGREPEAQVVAGVRLLVRGDPGRSREQRRDLGQRRAPGPPDLLV